MPLKPWVQKIKVARKYHAKKDKEAVAAKKKQSNLRPY